MNISAELGKMYGPLPLGAWIAVVGGGLAFALYQRNQSQSTPDSSDWTDTDTDPGVGLGGVPAGYTYTGGDDDDTDTDDDTSDGSGQSYSITDNASWGRAATNELIGLGYDSAAAATAIGVYMNGGSPTATQWALIRVALSRVGAMPDPVPTQNNPPSTTPTTNSFKPKATETRTGTWYVKSSAKAYTKDGKATSVTRPKDYAIIVEQWGTIGNTTYARSRTYYYRYSDLKMDKTAKPKPAAKPAFKAGKKIHDVGTGWHLKAAGKAYDKYGTAKASRPKNYGVLVVSWGTINGKEYARSVNYYYPESNLYKPSAKKTTPKAAPKSKAKPKAKKATPKPKTKTYTVKRGDNLTNIGHKFGISWQRIYNANKGKISNPNLIRVGQKLTIPAS